MSRAEAGIPHRGGPKATLLASHATMPTFAASPIVRHLDQTTAPVPNSYRRLVASPLFSALDNPAWTSLTGPHAPFAERHGRVLRYPADVAPFVAIRDQLDDDVWRSLAELAGPGAVVRLADPASAPPDGWEVVGHFSGVQRVQTSSARTRKRSA
jgi:hypothetical protein